MAEAINVTKEFDATLENLDPVLNFINEHLENVDTPMKALNQIDIAAEEIYVNVAHYAYEGKQGYAWIDLSIENDVMTLTIRDSGVPFDPLAKEDPDITLKSEDRDIGGLGIYMVKQMMDEFRYVWEDGQNKQTLVKKLR